MWQRLKSDRLMMVVIAGGVLVSVTMGIRQSFGLFLTPFSYEYGLPITVWAFAVALHNLLWGLAQPFVGALADRYGAPLVIIVGALIYCAGLAITGLVPSEPGMIVGTGLMVGFAMSCTSFGVILAAIGRAAAPEKRSSALGLATAIGSIGQIIVPPLTQFFIDQWGTGVAFFCLAALILLVMPFCLPLGRAEAPGAAAIPAPSFADTIAAVRAALADRNYVLLTLGFFTCGFQLAFVTTHLPGYLVLCHLPIGLGATALAVIGFFNMIGSWLCGQAGNRWQPHKVLGWLYIIRAATFCGFLLLPKTPEVVLGFAAVLGFTWLGTIPLTSGVIARLFGVRNMGMLARRLLSQPPGRLASSAPGSAGWASS